MFNETKFENIYSTWCQTLLTVIQSCYYYYTLDIQIHTVI